MPGNIITINNALRFYVGDSNMPELMRLLKKRGHKYEDAEPVGLDKKGGQPLKPLSTK